MFNLNFKEKYKVVHLTNEIGKYVIGGMGTYINELYNYRNEETGFIHIYNNEEYNDIFVKDYPGQEDILAVSHNEHPKLNNLNCDVIVIHFYELAFCINQEVLKGKKLVYVVHSVPTPEPMPLDDPFGGHQAIREKFEFLCQYAHAIICVSHAEKEKLCSIYPYFKNKTKVIYNGITLLNQNELNQNYMTSRKIFGYIGRMDYRKGILECIKAFKNIDGELRVACSNSEPYYFNKLLDCIEMGDMQEKVNFYGWCVGARKESFLNSLDALIIPSLYEPFGYVVVEAMNYGLPVISSHRGGLGEIVGEYKYKYNPYGATDLHDTIIRFQEDSKENIKEQQIFLNERLKYFSVERMIESYNNVFSEL